jgi:hypothetical protein
MRMLIGIVELHRIVEPETGEPTDALAGVRGNAKGHTLIGTSEPRKRGQNDRRGCAAAEEQKVATTYARLVLLRRIL